MQSFIADVRYGLRTLIREPGFTLTVVLTLALGIGANTAIFSVIYGVFLRPLPFPDPDRLIVLNERGKTFGPMSVSYPNYLDWRSQNDALEEMGAFQRDSYSMTGRGEPQILRGARASASLFRTLGVKAQIGRTFSDQEDRPGGERVVVLGYGLWQRQFGSDSAVLSTSITLDGVPHTVIGVMPRGYCYPSDADLWTAVGARADDPNWSRRGNHPDLYCVGRLKPGVTLQAADAGMDIIAKRLEQRYPEENDGNTILLRPLKDGLVGEFRPAAMLLLGAVALVLLIACANVANLLMVRSAGRQREMALRAALGAGRWRIVRQLLTENLILALIAGVAGLVLATWGTPTLVALAAQNLPRSAEVGTHGPVLVFTVGISVLTGLLFGLMPAVNASRVDLADPLKETSRGGSAGRAQRLAARGLVVAEVALALLLLTGAGLLARSFVAAASVDLGYDQSRVLTLGCALPVARYKGQDAARAFGREVFTRLRALPGVESLALSSGLPLEGNWQSGFEISGRPLSMLGERPSADEQRVSSDYFKTMGIRFLKGATFDPTLDVNVLRKQVIINDVFAAKYWPGEDAVGKYVLVGAPIDTPEYRYQVIGVVATVKFDGPDVDSGRVQLYLPYEWSPRSCSILIVKTAGDPEQWRRSIVGEVHAIDPELAFDRIRTMEQVGHESLGNRRLLLVLVGMFSVVAVLLATVGVYGVMSYAVSQRMHELGIRIALGAGRLDLLWLVARQGLVLALLGAGAGAAAAFVLVRVMSSSLSGILFQVSPGDPSTLTAVAVFLVLVALVASLVPAYRASRVDAAVALRRE